MRENKRKSKRSQVRPPTWAPLKKKSYTKPSESESPHDLTFNAWSILDKHVIKIVRPWSYFSTMEMTFIAFCLSGHGKVILSAAQSNEPDNQFEVSVQRALTSKMSGIAH